MAHPFPPSRASRAKRIEPTILDAIGMWSAYHHDEPPIGRTGDPWTDLRITDAFRMMIFLDEPKQRLRWIECEVRDPNGQHVGCPYRAELCRWWLDIFEHEFQHERMAS